MGQFCTTIQQKIGVEKQIQLEDCVCFDFTKYYLIKSNHINSKKYKVFEITDDLVIKVVGYIKNKYQAVNLSFHNIAFPSNKTDNEDELQASIKAQDLIDQKLLEKNITFEIGNFCEKTNSIRSVINLEGENMNVWLLQNNIGISKSKIRPDSWLQYQQNNILLSLE